MEANYFDDELHGGETARANGQDVVTGSREENGAFAQSEGGLTSEGEESDLLIKES